MATEDPFAQPAHSVAFGAVDWAAAARHSLQRNGFVAIRGAGIDRSLCATLAVAVEDRLDRCVPR